MYDLHLQKETIVHHLWDLAKMLQIKSSLCGPFKIQFVTSSRKTRTS